MEPPARQADLQGATRCWVSRAASAPCSVPWPTERPWRRSSRVTTAPRSRPTRAAARGRGRCCTTSWAFSSSRSSRSPRPAKLEPCRTGRRLWLACSPPATRSRTRPSARLTADSDSLTVRPPSTRSFRVSRQLSLAAWVLLLQFRRRPPRPSAGSRRRRRSTPLARWARAPLHRRVRHRECRRSGRILFLAAGDAADRYSLRWRWSGPYSGEIIHPVADFALFPIRRRRRDQRTGGSRRDRWRPRWSWW
jgi:hypothetical protein